MAKKSRQTAQWISQGVVTLYPRKGKAFPGQTSKVLVWPGRQTVECTRGEKELKRGSKGAEWFLHGSSSHMSAYFSIHTVCMEKICRGKVSLALFGFRPSSCVSLPLYAPPTPTTHTHTHRQSLQLVSVCAVSPGGAGLA